MLGSCIFLLALCNKGRTKKHCLASTGGSTDMGVEWPELEGKQQGWAVKLGETSSMERKGLGRTCWAVCAAGHVCVRMCLPWPLWSKGCLHRKIGIIVEMKWICLNDVPGTVSQALSPDFYLPFYFWLPLYESVDSWYLSFVLPPLPPFQDSNSKHRNKHLALAWDIFLCHFQLPKSLIQNFHNKWLNTIVCVCVFCFFRLTKRSHSYSSIFGQIEWTATTKIRFSLLLRIAAQPTVFLPLFF